MANQRDLLDLSSLRLTAPPQQGAKYPASLAVGVWENKPQFTMRTGIESLPNYGLFSVTLYPYEFGKVLSGLLRISQKPFVEGERENAKLEVYDKPGNNAKLNGTIVYGRDDKGKMFICLVNPNPDYPKVVFYIATSGKFKISGISDQEDSADYTKGYVEFWKNLIPNYLDKNFVDTSQNSGGQGGGFNRGGNNNNYNNNSGGNQGGGASSNDDDIPF